MPDTLEKAELSQLRKYENELADLRSKYGQQQYVIDTLAENLEDEKEAKLRMKKKLDQTIGEYRELVTKLQSKYGDVDVDLDTGDVK